MSARSPYAGPAPQGERGVDVSESVAGHESLEPEGVDGIGRTGQAIAILLGHDRRAEWTELAADVVDLRLQRRLGMVGQAAGPEEVDEQVGVHGLAVA